MAGVLKETTAVKEHWPGPGEADLSMRDGLEHVTRLVLESMRSEGSQERRAR